MARGLWWLVFNFSHCRQSSCYYKAPSFLITFLQTAHRSRCSRLFSGAEGTSSLISSYGLAAGVQCQLCYSTAVTLFQAAVKTATLWKRTVRSSSGAFPHALGAAHVLAFAPCLTSFADLALFRHMGCAWPWHRQTFFALLAGVPWCCIPYG